MMILGVKNVMRSSSLMRFSRGFAQVTNEPVVIKQNKSAISRITLNRPSAYNSIDRNTIDAFQSAVQDAEEDPNIKAIFLRGTGKAFCSGGDVKYFLSSLNGDPTNMTFRGYASKCYNQIYRNSKLQTPLVSILDGITMGLGAGLTVYGPFRIVTENTKYAMPETNIGLFCDTLCTHYLSRLDTDLAKYITMTGNILKGEDVLFAGIGTHFVPSSRVDELEDHMSKETDLNLDKINSIIQKYSVDEAHNPGSHVLNAENSEIIRRCFKFDNANDIMDALEKDGTEFALNAKEAILKRSPTCTVINVENFKRAPNMSFIELMEMELNLWFRVAGLHDFSEGIRSNIILKQKPNWNPSSIKDVSIDFLRKNIYQDGVDFEPTVYHSYDTTFAPQNQCRYTLPTKKDILDAQREHGLTTLEETVKWFQDKHDNKFGIRQKIESLNIM